MDIIEQAAKSFYDANVPAEDARQYVATIKSQLQQWHSEGVPPEEAKQRLAALQFEHQDSSGNRIPITPFAPAQAAATEPDISMVRKAYDVVTKPVEPKSLGETYTGSIGEAIKSFGRNEEGTWPGRQINDYLATRGYPNLGAAVGTLTEMPGSTVRHGAGILNTVGALLGIPTAGRMANEALQNIGMGLGLPEPVAGALGTAANVTTNFALPGVYASGAQRVAQSVLPHVSGAVAAMLEKQVGNFQSLLTTKIGSAEERLAAKNEAFKALDPANVIPLKETVSTIRRVLAQERPERTVSPSPLVPKLEALLANIEARGGGLNPIDLNRNMKDIGEAVGSIRATAGVDVNPLAARIFAALSKDASTPTQRVTNATPRIQGPTLALPAPGEGSAAVAGSKFEAGPMSKTIQLPPQNKQLALPSPATEPAVEWGGKFEAGKVPMTKQVQSPATERGKFIYDEAGNARPDVYTAPGTGEVPYSGVTVMREGVRPVNEPTVLGRRQSVLDQVGQQPYRNARGGLQPKELKEPWQPGMPVRKLEVTDESARPITPTTSTGRRQRVLSESEQGAYRDPATGEIVAPGTRVQQTDTSGQVVLDRRAAYREKKALDDIQVTFDKLLKAKRGLDSEFRDFNAAQMRNYLAQRPKLVEGIPAPDMFELEQILAKISELPNLPPPKGIMYGSGKVLETAATAGGIAFALGGGPQAAAKLGGLITGFQAASRALLPTAIGRKAVLAVLDSGPINQTKVNMLAALAQVARLADQKNQDIKDGIAEALKTPAPPAAHMKTIQQVITNNN